MPWFLDGNAGTLANNFFLGTLDNAPLCHQNQCPLLYHTLLHTPGRSTPRGGYALYPIVHNGEGQGWHRDNST